MRYEVNLVLGESGGNGADVSGNRCSDVAIAELESYETGYIPRSTLGILTR